MSNDMRRTLINFFFFQACWFSCVIGAASGAPMFGLLVVMPAVLAHLTLTVRARPELALIGISVLLGLVFDSLIVGSGWIRYPSGTFVTGVAPYWILGIWAIFATTLNTSMKWLKGRPLLAAAMGAVFGPLSYLAGARLGGVEFLNFEAAILLLAVAWAIALPVLMVAANRFNGISPIESPVNLQLIDSRRRILFYSTTFAKPGLLLNDQIRDRDLHRPTPN
jgi:hypothetical protein